MEPKNWNGPPVGYEFQIFTDCGTSKFCILKGFVDHRTTTYHHPILSRTKMKYSVSIAAVNTGGAGEFSPQVDFINPFCM